MMKISQLLIFCVVKAGWLNDTITASDDSNTSVIFNAYHLAA